jgi:hypothetical protein
LHDSLFKVIEYENVEINRAGLPLTLSVDPLHQERNTLFLLKNMVIPKKIVTKKTVKIYISTQKLPAKGICGKYGLSSFSLPGLSSWKG